MAPRMALVLAAPAVVALAMKLRASRAGGQKWRTPHGELVRFLLKFNSRVARFLASYAQRHTVQTYVVGILFLYFLWKYQLRVGRFLRYLRWNRKATHDVLTDYPDEDEVTTETIDAEVHAMRKRDAPSTLPEPLVSSAEVPESRLLGFLNLMGYLIQGIDEGAAASIYQKMKRVQAPAGTVLFRQGADASDGMYVIVKGLVGVYAEDDLTILSHALPPSPHAAASLASSTADASSTSSSRDTPVISTPPGSKTSTPRHSGPSTPPRPAPGPKPAGDLVETASDYGGDDSASVGSGSYEFGQAALYGPIHGQPKRPSPVLATFGAASTVGENALLGGEHEKRAVTLKALTATEALVLDRSLFKWFINQLPHALVSFVMTTTARQWRVAYVTLVDILHLPGAWHASVEPSDPAFQGMNDELTQNVIDASSGTMDAEAGEAIYEEGDAADCVYVLLEGRASCFATRNGQLVVTRNLTPGCLAGAQACFVGLQHRSTLRCTEACVFAIFPRRLFEVLSHHAPAPLSHEATAILVKITLEAAKTLTPLLRMFLHLGLQRLWLHSGDYLFHKGDKCEGLYLVISGRLRTFDDGDVPADQRPISADSDSDSEEEEGDAEDDKRGQRKEHSNRPSHVFKLDVGRGETVGEMEVLSRVDRRAGDAVCIRDCELVKFSKAAFSRILERFPRVMKQFTEVLAKRYQDLAAKMSLSATHGFGMHGPKPNYVTIAVVPAGGAPPPLSTFSVSIGQALGNFGSVLHVTSTKLDDALGVGMSQKLSRPFERAKAASWLSTQEESHRFLILEADLEYTAWSRACIEQADCVLLVGMAHSSPTLSEHERMSVFHVADGCNSSDGNQTRSKGLRAQIWDWISMKPRHDKAGTKTATKVCAPRSFSRKELILLHTDPSRRPSGTRAWLRLRRIGWHHHVRTPYVADFERVARHLCGQARGVVLGGGGARGIAHLGVLELMTEQNFPIDLIGGTSQGAYMAAAYAMTLNVPDMKPMVKLLEDRIGSVWSLMKAFTLPIFSYFDGGAFNEMLRDAFGDVQIEDLWIRYFCISTNVSRSRMEIHSSGPLWKYARASMTVLGLLPPIYDRGSLLVDGGYLNNMPVDVMRELAPQMAEVVAVDVENKDTTVMENVEDYGDSISGWWLLAKLIASQFGLTTPVKLPGLHDVTMSLSYISHTIRMREMLERPDDTLIYVQPDVQNYRLLDYNLFQEIKAKGKAAAKETFKKLLKRRRRAQRLAEQQRSQALAWRSGTPDLDVANLTSHTSAMRNSLSLHHFSMLDLHRITPGARDRVLSAPQPVPRPGALDHPTPMLQESFHLGPPPLVRKGAGARAAAGAGIGAGPAIKAGAGMDPGAGAGLTDSPVPGDIRTSVGGVASKGIVEASGTGARPALAEGTRAASGEP